MLKRIKFIFTTVVICVFTNITSASETQVFKCKTDKGKFVYQSEPCADSQFQQQLKLDTSTKGHKFANPQSLQNSNKSAMGETDRRSPNYSQFKSLKENIRRYESQCQKIKADIPTIIKNIEVQCEKNMNTFCREAARSSLAGKVNVQTWRSWYSYNKINKAFEQKEEQCSKFRDWRFAPISSKSSLSVPDVYFP